MTSLSPLETLYSETIGDDLDQPEELAALYGRLRFPTPRRQPHVVGNFVSTLDGVISLGIPGRAGGREISGFNPHDRMVMGLLRAVADVVIVSAGSFRSSSMRRWTADSAFPPLADAYSTLRHRAGKAEPPLTVVVTASGRLGDGRSDVASGSAPFLFVTTPAGAGRLQTISLPASAQVIVGGSGRLTARRVLEIVASVRPSSLVLVEAGPRLMGDFIAERLLDELFLTFAPQIAGRDDRAERPGFVAGTVFAPDDQRWGTLVDLKRGGSHLFLRYALQADERYRPTPQTMEEHA